MSKTINVVEMAYGAAASGKVHLPAKVGIYPYSNIENFFHAMSSMVEGFENFEGSVGVRWVSYFLDNNRTISLPNASSVMTLNDAKTGLPYCIMEGMHLTNMRTAASGAIAAKKFANPNATVLGIVGAGKIARWSVRAIKSVFPSIKEIKVISRTKSSINNFCSEMSELYKDIKFSPHSNLKSLVNKSDIILTITSNTDEPYISFDWLQEGALAISLDDIRSWKSSFKNADKIITDDKDYFLELIDGYLELKESKLHGVSELLEKSKGLEWSEDERNIVFMNGIGSTDIMIANYIYKLAVESGKGQTLQF